MFKEYEAFEAAAAGISRSEETLREEIKQKKVERQKATQKYRQMIVEEASESKGYTGADILAAKQRADELDVEIEVSEKRLEILVSGKGEKLESSLSDVRSGWLHEVNQLNTEISRVFFEARVLRAQLVLKVLEAHQYYEKSWKLRNAFHDTQRKAGINGPLPSMGVPEYVPTGWDSGLLPDESELLNAYRSGKLNPIMEHFVETGDLLTMDELRQAAKSVGSKVADKEAANPGLLQTAAQGAKGLIDKVLGKDR